MTTDQARSISRIPLERPASVRRHLPDVGDDGWAVSEFIVGDENAGLNYIFNDTNIRQLHSLSPVVFYGEKGTGKTALSITLAVRWARMTGSRPLCFTTGKSFASDYAAAVEIDDINSFRARHRECKLLVIDDLEPLTEKSSAQDELTHTIDALAETQSPVIVSVGTLPPSLAGIKPALSSRLSAGYSIPLHRPGIHSRRAIVASLVDDIDKSLPTNALADYCVSLDSVKVHDLRTIVTIAHQNKTSTGAINFDIVAQLTRQHLSGATLSVASIAKVVARKMRVKLTDMRGSTREASIVRARGLAILLARRLTPLSLQQIGLFFGGRDHSTVLHAFRKTDRLLESDTELSKVLSDVQAELLS